MLKQAHSGAELIVLINARLVRKNSRGTAALKGSALKQPATGAKQEAAHMVIVQILNAQAVA